MFYVTHLSQSHSFRFSKTATTLYTILTYLLAAVLAFSGIAKLVDASALLQTLQQVPFLNEGLTIWIATMLPVVEIGLAAALFLQWNLPVTLAFTTLLFVGFLGFAIYGLTAGLAGDCCCFGGLAESSFGWGMVVRDGIFVSLSITVLVICNKQHLRKQE